MKEGLRINEEDFYMILKGLGYKRAGDSAADHHDPLLLYDESVHSHLKDSRVRFSPFTTNIKLGRRLGQAKGKGGNPGCLIREKKAEEEEEEEEKNENGTRFSIRSFIFISVVL